MSNKLILIFNTVRYLKGIQLYYQLWYRLKAKIFQNKSYSNSFKTYANLKWENEIYNLNTYKGGGDFLFLNKKSYFGEFIDWNYSSYGKLWVYNLNYFDFLNQKDISKEEGLKLMRFFVSFYGDSKDGKEPYPTSLRIINWVKFIAKHNINDKEIFKIVREDANRLKDNLEYHLLANHLLENGFAMFFAGYLFNDKSYFSVSKKLIKKELNEQILNDGVHFELSPMYHQIILHRLLDCIELMKLNIWEENDVLVSFLKEKAKKMLSSLQTISFQDGSIPMVNDSTHNIAITSQSLFSYAESLKLEWSDIQLSNSGYRKFNSKHLELLIDVGQVGPSYQPGHAHADTFNFLLHVNNKPIIVDPGLSTYEINNTRTRERSTSYHNTVTVNDLDSSQVWSGFRVAKRAEVRIVEDTNTIVSAVHNGYNKLNIEHHRKFNFESDSIIIEDQLINSKDSKAHFHFHPSCKVDISENANTILINEVEMSFVGNTNMKIEDYMYAQGFNKTIIAKKVVILFRENLATKIKLKFE